ncbi:MAG: N-acetyltransferase family protein [Rhodospirillales bacterium]
MTPVIRDATPEDAAQIAAIYAPVVRDTVISFEISPPSDTEIAQRIIDTLKTFPWLVAADGGVITGYAYASQHRTRAAYRWSVDVTVYMHPDYHRRGIASALYRHLFTILAEQNYHAAFSGITLPNAGSVGLHETLGFEPVGIYREVGFKMGSWQDVGWWRKPLRTSRAGNDEPVPYPALKTV